MGSAVLLAVLVAAAAESPAEPPAVPAPATPEARAPASPTPPVPAADRPGAHAARDERAALRSTQDGDKAAAEKADKVDPRPEPLPSRPAPEKPAAEAGSQRPISGGTLPPSLTARALLEELRRAAKDRHVEQTSIDEQRQKLEALQREVETSRAALREETKRLQELVAAAATAERKDGKRSKETALDTLAKTARGMKPDAAAGMLSRLDRGLAAAILARMRPADAAAVLDKMEPATSASLVALLSGRDRS